MTPMIIPQLDANTVDVTITEWRKQVGDAVVQGEILAVLTTDKAAYDFEAPVSGQLLAIRAPAKSIVPTGSVIGLLGELGEEVGAGLCASPVVQDARTDGTSSRESVPAAPRVRATPRARRLATEKGFDLAAIQAALKIDIIDEAALAAYEQMKGNNK